MPKLPHPHVDRLGSVNIITPGEVSSSLALPHGNSCRSSQNCLSRRRRPEQLLQPSPGRRLYSSSLASSRLGCSQQTCRHLERVTSTSLCSGCSHWQMLGLPLSLDCLHIACTQRSLGGQPEATVASANLLSRFCS